MNTPFDSDTLAAAEVCFAVASQLLYLEPEIAPVAEQVASRQFASAPFGEGNDDERQGLHLLDGWCAVALNASEVPEEASADEAAARLVESPAFAEAVAELRREWLRLFVGLGTPEASCLESFYVEPNSHMFGKNVIAVREAYRRHGLEIERLHREPDDHLGLMLGFLSRLMAEEREAVEAGDKDAALEHLTAASRKLDKAVSKGVIHKNQAANRKSGIMRLANTVVTAEDIAAYEKPAPKPQKTGSKKAAAKAAREAGMAAASEEKAKRREKQLKEEKKAAERKAKEAEEAAKAEAEAAAAEAEAAPAEEAAE